MKRWLRSFTWSGHSVGMLAFLALFPGFFFYHTLLGLGLMSAVLGGYFAPASLLFAPPLLFFYAYTIRRRAGQLGRPDVLFLLYIAYFSIVIGIHAAVGANPVIIGNHLLGILFTVNLFLMFRLTDFGSAAFRVICLATIAAMSAIVFAYSVDGSFYLAPLGTAKNPESLATYQGFSRSYLLTFIVAVCFSRALALRVLLYCVAAPTLFVNTARSEFVAMLFVVPIIELYYSQRKVLMASVIGVLCLLVYINLDQILALLPSNRILELLDLSQSTSANKRHHLTMYAMNTIAQFPVFGDYASYNPGFYSHNVLSAWVDTGLFGFLFVLAILVLPILQMLLRGYFLPSHSSSFILPFVLACSTLLLLATSHYFTDMVIGAALGSYSRYRYGRKHATHRSSDVSPPALRHAHFHQAVPDARAAGL
ncbi:hypothetical protein [Massilia sp. CF038]|uniref:hypothetical protein n=1 Tax=Massilia sp. CF038 TaxID=1881045 RepID=UPI00091ADD27|nr:hypothetical protein [Massilia sp. CF038]SHH02502.1 hypothetical protein SAMN05428948_2385 [Massilia sp. CF038]